MFVSLNYNLKKKLVLGHLMHLSSLPTPRRSHVAFSSASQAGGGEVSQSGRWVWDAAGFPLSFPVQKNVLRGEDGPRSQPGAVLCACGICVCEVAALPARPRPGCSSLLSTSSTSHKLHFNKNMVLAIPPAASLSIPACFQGSYPCSISKKMYPAVKKCLCSCCHPEMLQEAQPYSPRHLSTSLI